MGCINSTANMNDPNVFEVMNVDDLGNLITPGRLEVTEVDIVLYQDGRHPIRWPLRCLRRYGYDAEIFSFEAGRRCSTGPGIYAFKCNKAQHIFALVHTNIQACSNRDGDDTLTRELPVGSRPSTATARATISIEPSYLNPTPTRNNNRINSRSAHSRQSNFRRSNSNENSSGSISCQGAINLPLSPPMLPPPRPISQPISQLYPSSLYVNEEVLSAMKMKRNNNTPVGKVTQRSPQADAASNAASKYGSVEMELMPLRHGVDPRDRESHDAVSSLSMPTYANIDISREASPISAAHSISESVQLREGNGEIGGSGHPYVNINPKQEHIEGVSIRTRSPPLVIVQPDLDEGSKHCYVNLETSEFEAHRKRYSGTSLSERSLPPSTPTKEMTYAVLDLDRKEVSTSSTFENAANAAPSLQSPKKGYATIDFDKTAALSHSANPNLAIDEEGSRMTRHSFTTNDLPAPYKHRKSSVSE